MKAALGLPGRACGERGRGSAVVTARRARSARRCAGGSRITLSGGACGCAPTGAPTCWNSESAAGRSTTPSTRTGAGCRRRGRSSRVSPGCAWRFAAVCWASSDAGRRDRRAAATRPGTPARSRRAGRGPGRDRWSASSRRQRRSKPGGVARSRPAARSRRRGERRDLRHDARPGRRRAGPRPASRRRRGAIARLVICAVVADRNVPIDASSATPTATPSGGREQARAAVRDQAARARSARPCGLPGRSRPLCISQRSASRSATAGSWVATTSAAPTCSAAASSTSTTAAPLARSSWPVGSSARMQSRLAGQRAGDATRWAWPPESSSGSLLASSASPSRSSAPRARCARLGVVAPPSTSGSATFSATSAAAAGSGPGRRRRPARAQARARRAPATRPYRRSGSRARRAGAGASTCPDPDGPTSAIAVAGADLAVGRLQRDGRGRPGAVRARCAVAARRAARRSRAPPSRPAAGSRGRRRPRPPASWVTTSTAAPSSARSRSRSSTRAAVASSSSPVGSSASRSRGSLASATARPARASSPPESWYGRASRPRGDPARARAPRRARPRRRARREPLSERDVLGRPTGGRRGCAAGTAPRSPRAAGAARSLLAAARQPLAGDAHVPPSGSSRPARQASSVDLPEPDGPVTATSSPALDGERDALQRQRLVVARVEEAVQAARRQRGAHGDHRSESVTIRHGSTLSAPFGPDSVSITALAAVEEHVALDRVGAASCRSPGRAAPARVGDPDGRARLALDDRHAAGWKPSTLLASCGSVAL